MAQNSSVTAVLSGIAIAYENTKDNILLIEDKEGLLSLPEQTGGLNSDFMGLGCDAVAALTFWSLHPANAMFFKSLSKREGYDKASQSFRQKMMLTVAGHLDKTKRHGAAYPEDVKCAYTKPIEHIDMRRVKSNLHRLLIQAWKDTSKDRLFYLPSLQSLYLDTEDDETIHQL